MRCLAATPYRLKWYTFQSVFLVQNYIGANIWMNQMLRTWWTNSLTLRQTASETPSALGLRSRLPEIPC
jgi:hypothetical protein